jgi:hypothetical protein
MPAIDRMPTWVYRCLCTHEALLYVGLAVDVDRRIAQHVATKDWWGEVSFVDAELYPTRFLAYKMESFYIVYDKPKYNVQGAVPVPIPPHQPTERRGYLNYPDGIRLAAHRKLA